MTSLDVPTLLSCSDTMSPEEVADRLPKIEERLRQVEIWQAGTNEKGEAQWREQWRWNRDVETKLDRVVTALSELSDEIRTLGEDLREDLQEVNTWTRTKLAAVFAVLLTGAGVGSFLVNLLVKT